jgi:hypothetical protein
MTWIRENQVHILRIIAKGFDPFSADKRIVPLVETAGQK